MIPLRIVMACYNGESYLPQQLSSLEAQTFGDWSLDISDDGSSDATQEILKNFRKISNKEIRVFDGPRDGVAAAFLTLAMRAVLDAPNYAIAFSDQDDVWFKLKLERALRWMSSVGDVQKDILVYASRTILTDTHLNKIGISHLHSLMPSFQNAIVQNILGGNTIVLSPEAAKILANSTPVALEFGVPYHDWWIYQILSGSGARIFNDPEPSLYYRQHSNNQIGHHGIFRGRYNRIKTIASGSYSKWISSNLRALSGCQDLLTPHSQFVLSELINSRQYSGISYARTLKNLGVHRQTPAGNLMLQLMATTGLL